MLKIINYAVFSVYLFLSYESFAGVTPSNSEQTNRLRITNQCNKTLWIQQDYKSKTNDPIVVEIPQGSSYDYNIPDEGLASTRFWPKSGCNSHGYDCTVGESTGVPEAEAQGYQHGPYSPDINSKFEATWGCLKAIFANNPSLCAVNPSDPNHHLNAETWWNGSAVDGYTFPYAITVKKHNSSCMDLMTGKVIANPGVNCGHLSADACPSDANLSTEGKFNTINGVNVTHVNLQWLDSKTGTPIGCFSPCSKLTTAQGSDNGHTEGGWHNILGGIIPQSPEAQMYCCPTPPISPGVCSAGPAARSSYSLSVHTGQQCDSYTYAYDDAKGLARCGSQTQFEITFCPKSTPSDEPQEPVNTPVSMKMIVPNNVNALVDGEKANNNQIVSINKATVLSIENGASCTVGIDDKSVIKGLSGSLCTQLVFDNLGKTITFPSAEQGTGLKLQFNMNTSVGISAYLNNTLIVNATPIESKGLPNNSVLTAYQGNKQASCNLTINSDTVQKANGEFCARLNITKEGNDKIHVYLPADIPNMGGTITPPINQTRTIIFGMASGTYAYFNKELVTNGSQITLTNVPDSKNINLIAYQNQNSANCLFGKAGEALDIIPNSGILCNSGLVLVTGNNGDYYIGLPNPIPANKDTKLYSLGIAKNMSVTVNGKTIQWNAASKTVLLAQGNTSFKITGIKKTVRTCVITRYADVLTWTKTAACQGIVHNGGVIYFPSFN